MQKLSEQQRAFLWEATQRYRVSLPGSAADAYLQSRGLSPEDVAKFGLGYVGEPLPGHEMYRGSLAIPYMRHSPWRGWSVASIRFRCLHDHEHTGHGKYMTMAGDTPRLYNTVTLTRPAKEVAITEGEIDAITAQSCGIPTVGVPGASMWKDYYPELFIGYRKVYVLADGDDAGMKFADAVAKTLPNAKVVTCPPGEDVNSLVVSRGKGALLERIS